MKRVSCLSSRRRGPRRQSSAKLICKFVMRETGPDRRLFSHGISASRTACVNADEVVSLAGPAVRLAERTLEEPSAAWRGAKNGSAFGREAGERSERGAKW